MAEKTKSSSTNNAQSFSDIFKDKSVISVVIATLVLLLVSFFAFRYFGNNNGSLNGNGLSDILSTKSEEPTVDASVTPGVTPEATVSASDETKETDTKVVSSTNSSGWVAKDYSASELKGKNNNKHTVVSGDTLWEIAEAYYGNGAEWTKIASANNVSYLSNGNPLIIPGQVLTIP